MSSTRTKDDEGSGRGGGGSSQRGNGGQVMGERWGREEKDKRNRRPEEMFRGGRDGSD